jgi:cytidyltransferase-like protein
MNKVVLVTGGFDPLHSGHLAYFNEAKKLGDKLIVGVNSDEWLTRKKGRPFMPFTERVALIQEMEIVDKVIGFDDSDDSACQAIFHTLSTHGDIKLIFANGGDRTNTTTPEYATYGDMPNVEFAFGVGGEDKKNSSSWILDEWKAPKTKRTWGYYRVIHEYDEHTKVKELAVPPGGKLSMQRHKERSEHWFVAEGTATVYTINTRSTDVETLGTYNQHESLHIPVGTWHQLANEHDTDLKLVEIQYGTNCVEEDIERRN